MEDLKKNERCSKFGKVSGWELRNRNENHFFIREGENGAVVCMIEINQDGTLKYFIRHPDKDKMVPYDSRRRINGESDHDFIARVMRECDEIAGNEYGISPAYEHFSGMLRKFRQKSLIIERIREGRIRPEIGKVLLGLLEEDAVETHVNYSAYFDPSGVYLGLFPSSEGINACSFSPLRALIRRYGLN
jgi:hypothetical protein